MTNLPDGFVSLIYPDGSQCRDRILTDVGPFRAADGGEQGEMPIFIQDQKLIYTVAVHVGGQDGVEPAGSRELPIALGT